MPKRNAQEMLKELVAVIPAEGMPYADLVEMANEMRVAPALRSLRKLEKSHVVAFRIVLGVNTIFKTGEY